MAFGSAGSKDSLVPISQMSWFDVVVTSVCPRLTAIPVARRTVGQRSPLLGQAGGLRLAWVSQERASRSWPS